MIQLYSALLHNAYLRGFIEGEIYRGKAKYACAPGLNCYSCPGAVASCPLGALQNALASTGHRAGWYVLGILLLYGVILGRTVCGWLCPMGWLQELLDRVPTLKIRKSRVTRALTWVKYALLAVFVAGIPLWYGLRHDMPLPAFCKYICPAGTLEGAVGHLVHPANDAMLGMLGALFTRKFVIMLAIALACVFCYRAFCRFFCPLGAIYGLFNRFSIVGIRVDADRCTRCGACVGACAMDVGRVGDRECIQCGRCMDACAAGAISFKAGRITLIEPQTGPGRAGQGGRAGRKALRRTLWAAAAALLCLALVWFNFLDPAVQEAKDDAAAAAAAAMEKDSSDAPDAVDRSVQTKAGGSVDGDLTPDAPIGNDVGERLEDFTLTCYDGTQFRLAEHRGQVVIINLWATYCTPCLQELPYFSALCEAHGGELAVIAVHPSLVTDDPREYLEDKGYAMLFATDDNEDTVVNIVGGTGTLPQTVVLDRGGKVTYNDIGSVTPELLQALYEDADGQ